MVRCKLTLAEELRRAKAWEQDIQGDTAPFKEKGRRKNLGQARGDTSAFEPHAPGSRSQPADTSQAAYVVQDLHHGRDAVAQVGQPEDRGFHSLCGERAVERCEVASTQAGAAAAVVAT